MNYDCMAEQSNKIQDSVLMVTTTIYKEPTGGRGLMSKLNADVLRTLYGNHLHIYELQRSPLRGIINHYNDFLGLVDGLNAATIDEICAIVRYRNVRHVFVDGSNLGALVDVLKRRFNSLVITVFFHNVEARFFWGNFVASKSIRSLAILVANCLAECKATCLSDKRICLSERDSNLLKRIYGKNATYIAPMAMEDKLPSFGDDGEPTPYCKPFALFVGGSFTLIEMASPGSCSMWPLESTSKPVSSARAWKKCARSWKYQAVSRSSARSTALLNGIVELAS